MPRLKRRSTGTSVSLACHRGSCGKHSVFEPAFPIHQLRPADYNPRQISEQSLADLATSLKTLGIVKPVVALQDGLIVAGHQRTRAAVMAGFTETPVCFLSKKPNPQDEIRFNQLHNGTDNDSGDEAARVEQATVPGFAMVKLLSGNFRAAGASIRSEVARMLSSYGNWGGCVATMDGEVLSGGSYALAASAIGYDVRVYYVDDARAARVRELFAKQYGRYHYGKIERQTFNQTFAQMFRLRGIKKANASPTYEWLLEDTSKSARILDFGCGQGDYVRALGEQGYDIQGLEFFCRDGNALDVAAAQRMIDTLILSLRFKGLFEVVICDYVLNSVDSQQAEDDVMACVNAFLKPGGIAYFSGRPMSRINAGANMTKRIGAHREVEFLDENNISALFRGGEWFFQKFHDREQIEAIVAKHFRDDGSYEQRGKSSSWQVRVVKGKQSAGIVDGITREFDLPLPGGKSFGRHADVLKAMRSFI